MAAGFHSSSASIGRWRGEDSSLATDVRDIAERLHAVHRPLFAVATDHGFGVTDRGTATVGDDASEGRPLLAVAPASPAAQLGDHQFIRDHGMKLAYVAGAMAGGIASAELVEAMSRSGMLGLFGAAGLDLGEVERGIVRLSTRLLDRPWGSNLIHSPYEPALEAAVVDLYLRHGVRLVSASAYLGLTLPLLRYRLHGIHRAPNGEVVVPNRVIAKVSRTEVAEKFLAPAPESMLRELVGSGALTQQQAALASTVPVCSDLTAEADSGGHTDNRPAVTLIPSMIALRDRMCHDLAPEHRPRVGAAGGIATPQSAAAAFAMGAAFVVTGTINQACLEAGTSDEVRRMLAEAGQADVTMAPAADMFEMGVELQVLRRGTLFPMRARKLWTLYREHASLESMSDADRRQLATVLSAPVDEVWSQTEQFWAQRDPAQLDRAATDPKHKMALCFRWYLGKASRWANAGVTERRADYQVWCGPAIGAFNEWTRGTFLEAWTERRASAVALNIMHGAAVLTRVASLRAQGLALRSDHVDIVPRPLGTLQELSL